MSQSFPGVTPLNWHALVAEALDRRKREKLTQREHAALADVSIPTLAAFERGERTLSLAKAFDILRVVGLVEEPDESGAQEVFVQAAFARWMALVKNLPKDSPARFPHGWYRFDYALEGDLREIEPHRFKDVLAKAVTPHTGWPVFWVPTREEIAPREVDGTIQCWLSPADGRKSRSFDDAAHCDFWRASPTGRMFLMRGYQEDGQETFAPGKIFDTGLPIWRMGEALLHAARLASLLKREEAGAIAVKFRAHYTGLTGRVLKAWANPLVDFLDEGSAARSDEAMLEAVVPAAEIEANLAAHVFPLAALLYERFGVAGLSPSRVQAELAGLLKSRMP